MSEMNTPRGSVVQSTPGLLHTLGTIRRPCKVQQGCDHFDTITQCLQQVVRSTPRTQCNLSVCFAYTKTPQKGIIQFKYNDIHSEKWKEKLEIKEKFYAHWPHRDRTHTQLLFGDSNHNLIYVNTIILSNLYRINQINTSNVNLPKLHGFLFCVLSNKQSNKLNKSLHTNLTMAYIHDLVHNPTLNN